MSLGFLTCKMDVAVPALEDSYETNKLMCSNSADTLSDLKKMHVLFPTLEDYFKPVFLKPFWLQVIEIHFMSQPNAHTPHL